MGGHSARVSSSPFTDRMNWVWTVNPGSIEYAISQVSLGSAQLLGLRLAKMGNLTRDFPIAPACNSVTLAVGTMDSFYYSVVHSFAWLIAIGLLSLLLGIPLSSKLIKDSPVKTEFHTTQAAYWCVVVGTLGWALALIGALVGHVLKR